MIHVRRLAAPEILTSKAADLERAGAAKFFRPRTRDVQRSFEFKIYRDAQVSAALNKLFHGKCAYCESPSATAPYEAEHHRPRARALDLDGSVAVDHYWWLASDWTNLLPICNDCTRSKGTRFPVRGPRAEPGGDLRKERALLLDPCRDRPDRHLVFSEDGLVQSQTERGQATIEILGLNRRTLVAARREYQVQLAVRLNVAERIIRTIDPDPANKAEAAALEKELREVRRYLAARQPYGALHRQSVNRWLHTTGFADEKLSPRTEPLIREAAQKSILVTEEREKAAAQEFSEHSARQQEYSVEAEAPVAKQAFYSGAKRLEWFEIENFKGIEKLHLDFPTPTSEREPWLMLLGENGTGKSSILQALALALMGENHARDLGLDASRFVRADAKRGSGRVRVKLTNIPDPIVLRFRRESPQFIYETADPKVLLLGYGATRLLRPRLRPTDWGSSYVRVKNLFDPTAPLGDVESWLLDRKAVGNRRFDAIARALKDLLMLESDERFSRDRDGVQAVVGRRPPVPLRQLSDGFQSVVALAADVMKILLELWPTVEDAEGIVLLDELEAHLHPTWKIEIVERLRRTFPRVAFIVSTHDPLCLKGLQTGEIVLLRRDEARRIVADTALPAVNDLRADQILTSVMFGMHSTRGEGTAAAIDRYADLLSKTELTGDEHGEREQLKQRLQPTMSPHESKRQLVVEQAIWQTLVGTSESAPAPDLLSPSSLGEASLTPEMLELRRQLSDLLGTGEPTT